MVLLTGCDVTEACVRGRYIGWGKWMAGEDGGGSRLVWMNMYLLCVNSCTCVFLLCVHYVSGTWCVSGMSCAYYMLVYLLWMCCVSHTSYSNIKNKLYYSITVLLLCSCTMQRNVNIQHNNLMLQLTIESLIMQKCGVNNCVFKCRHRTNVVLWHVKHEHSVPPSTLFDIVKTYSCSK